MGKLYLDVDEVLLYYGVGAGPSDAALKVASRLPVIGRPREDAGGVPELARGGELAGGR
jgi:hypothetical protein